MKSWLLIPNAFFIDTGAISAMNNGQVTVARPQPRPVITLR
jgi:hypothetical protein